MSEEIRINPNSVVYVFEEDCSSWLADRVPPAVLDGNYFKPGNVYQQNVEFEVSETTDQPAPGNAAEILVTLKLPAANMLNRLHEVLKPLEEQGLTIDEVRPASAG